VFGGRALHGPAKGAYSAPPDPVPGFKGREKGREKTGGNGSVEREGAEEKGEGREVRRDGRGGKTDEKGEGEGDREISPPWSFLKWAPLARHTAASKLTTRL